MKQVVRQPAAPSEPGFDLAGFLPFLLHRAAEETGAAFEAVCRDRAGLGRADWRVLAHLGRAGPMTAAAICAATALHKTNVSRVVERMAGRGLLARDPDPADRRRETLSLTEAGRALHDALAAEALRFDAALTGRLGLAERVVVERALRLLASREQVANETD